MKTVYDIMAAKKRGLQPGGILPEAGAALSMDEVAQ